MKLTVIGIFLFVVGAALFPSITFLSVRRLVKAKSILGVFPIISRTCLFNMVLDRKLIRFINIFREILLFASIGATAFFLVNGNISMYNAFIWVTLAVALLYSLCDTILLTISLKVCADISVVLAFITCLLPPVGFMYLANALDDTNI